MVLQNSTVLAEFKMWCIISQRQPMIRFLFSNLFWSFVRVAEYILLHEVLFLGRRDERGHWIILLLYYCTLPHKLKLFTLANYFSNDSLTVSRNNVNDLGFNTFARVSTNTVKMKVSVMEHKPSLNNRL